MKFMKILKMNDNIKIKVYSKVYEPAEDSRLLMENLVNVKNKVVLDMGTGTGVQAINALKMGAKLVVGIDINPYAIDVARENALLNNLRIGRDIFFFKSDLFENIDSIIHTINKTKNKTKNTKYEQLDDKIDKFDVILFNAPYLPTSEEEKLEKYINYAFDGGLDGRKVIDRFICEVDNYLDKRGVLQIVQSSLTDEKRTIELLKKYGFEAKKTASMKFPYEELQVITARRM